MWKSISMGKENFFWFKINNGERVRYWVDPWCDRRPLAMVFLSCFNLTVNKGGLVKDHIIRSRVFCSWNIQPRRCLND